MLSSIYNLCIMRKLGTKYAYMTVVNYNWRSEIKRLEGAYAPATIRSYIADVAAFVQWCDVHGMIAFPAEVETVCIFLEDQAHSLVPSTVQHRLYAIRKIHRLLELSDPTGDERVNLAMRRVRRKKPNRPRQAKGLTRDYLEMCLAAQSDDPWGLRNRAMISLGYDLLTRRSELIALMTDDVEFTSDGTLRVIIRRSKADQFGMGRIAFGSSRSAKLLQAWLDWRGPHIRPLFCGIYHGKAINRGLGATTVKDILKKALAAAGLSAEEISLQRAFLESGSCPRPAAHRSSHRCHYAGRRLEVVRCSGTLSRDGGA